MIQSRTSNVPVLDGGIYTYRTTYKSHFKAFDNTAMKKRDILQPVSKRGDQDYQGKDQTKTAMSFPSDPLIPVIPPMITGLTMQRPKMHSESRKETTGLKEDKKDELRSSHHVQFQSKLCPTLPHLQAAQKTKREKRLEKQTTYSRCFSQSGAYSSAKFRECQPPKMNPSASINLREIADEKWTTASSEEFRPHKCGPVHLERRNCNDSHVFQGENLEGNQERLSATNLCFFPKIRNQFPKHVDGSAIRTLSDVKFGRPELAGCFYSTTSQEQFPPKEVDRPKPAIYPTSNMLREQEPDRTLSTTHTHFVPLNSRRQQLSPCQLHRVKYSHIRPEHSKHDFRTTHNDFFVPKPYCKTSLVKPLQHHITHIPF